MLDELATAEKLGQPHSVMRYGDGSWGDWKNRTLAIAYTIYQRGLHRCGFPMERAFSGALSGWVQAEWVSCKYCAAQDKERSELRPDDERHGNSWGTIPFDHFPYHDRDEEFRPWAPKPRELDV